MKPVFQHNVITSFAMWFEWFLLSKGEAFSNRTATLYPQKDDRLDPNLISYATPFKQWVTDSSITGAIIPQAITNTDTLTEIQRGEDGLIFDFQEGRVFYPNIPANKNLNLECTFSLKDFNIYLTDQTEEDIIVENKYDLNLRFKDNSDPKPVTPYDQLMPAIFISDGETYNKPFSFGGQDETFVDIRCVIFAEKLYFLDGVLSLFRDSKATCFPFLNFYDHPLNEYGDVKDAPSITNPTGSGYNYLKLASERKTGSNFYINNCIASKMKESVSNDTTKNLFIGFLDFEVTKVRMPRSI
jgi:hypothetical protein